MDGSSAWSVPRLYRWALGTSRLAPADRTPGTLLEYLSHGGHRGELAALAALAHEAPCADLDGRAFRADLEGLALLPPLLHPPGFRDFYSFEQHVKAARARRGLEMVPEWYEAPVFYFSNPHALVGPGAEVARPGACRELDFELEVAAVLERGGRDFSPADGEGAILGLCILNDWSARDIQRREMKVGLGPSKGKDFATSVGPWITTLDELADRRVGPGRFDLAMTARVNGREVSRANLKDMHFDFGRLVAHAAGGVELLPGELLGSGSAGTGCILELGPENVPWLEPGDVVELEVERLGLLRNTVVSAG
ncbi:MAG: fumarylacetoacetate hydrolase family protein [Candidatus Eisenbacteria bacterium]|nr:fumarylacetoacetate hydrolase family protein [Candidatus Eisenbacteria bacterium]